MRYLFSVFSPINELESYDFSSLTNDELVPYYPTVSYPSAVTNTEQLGQAIASNMSNFENQFTIYFEGNTNNLNDTIEQSYQWVEQNEPYLWAVLGGLSGRSTSYDNYAELEYTLNYDLTAEQNGLVFAKVKQLAAAVPDDLSDADKVKFVNDYIVKHTKYNSDSAANAHTPYAILLTGEGVCEGYALAAYLILKELGMDVQYVIGDAGGPHAWNMVKVDGNWYHLDTTWNDPIPDQGSKVRYDYFLLSDETLLKDHEWDTDLYPATAEDDYL